MCLSNAARNHTTVAEKSQDGPNPNLTLDERRLVGRARLHGIFSHEALLYEARVSNSPDGARLTDNPKHRQDLELWRLLLDVNRYYRGFDGIKQTWDYMQWRGTRVRLQQENATAIELWGDFVYAASINDTGFLKQICEDCVKHQMLTTRVFSDTVGSLLQYNPEQAPTFAYTLQLQGLGTPEDILNLFHIACESEAEGALQSFRHVRSLFPDVKIYSEAISKLVKLDRMDAAFEMHDFLVSLNDLPKSFRNLAPLIQHIAFRGTSIDPFLHSLRTAGALFDNQAHRLYGAVRAEIEKIGEQSVDANSSFTVYKEPKSVKDETIARTLATRGFSFEFVLRLFYPFGLIEFGPYSIRQMALTSGNLAELRSRFARLREMGVDLGSSSYMRIVKKLCDSGESELLAQFVQTDMHHEEFEDNSLQRSLLNEYLKKRDIMQLSRSLAILKVGDISIRAQSSAVNLMLRSAMDARDWTGILQMIQVFREHEYKVERPVIQHLHTVLSALSKPTEDGGPPDRDYAGFLIGVLQQLLVSGQEVHPSDWIWPLHTLGYLGRLQEVEYLALWIAAYYRSSGNVSWNADVALKIIFHAKILQKTISWSFREVSWRHGWPKELQSSGIAPWLRGAALLKKLRDEYGVVVPLPFVQEVFTANVRRMYGAEPISRMLANRRYAITRGVKVIDYRESWLKLWDGQTSERDGPPLMRRVSTKDP